MRPFHEVSGYVLGLSSAKKSAKAEGIFVPSLTRTVAILPAVPPSSYVYADPTR